MTLNEALKQLKALGDEKVRAYTSRCGAPPSSPASVSGQPLHPN